MYKDAFNFIKSMKGNVELNNISDWEEFEHLAKTHNFSFTKDEFVKAYKAYVELILSAKG